MSNNILGPEWNISPDGINIITENGAVKDPRLLLKKALDYDLKVIGKPALAAELSKNEVGKIVLQIQKIRNISAPKAKEESQAAPRMLKLTLTDGESYAQAIEITPISNISRDKTAPGTKVLLKGTKIVSGYLLINPQNFSVLGGQVEHLFDKWVLAKSVQLSHQNVSNTGAPPWVPFGCKILTDAQDRGFKSLDKEQNANGNSEFDQQRKEAIAEASSGAVKKSFGGRVRQNVQPTQNTQHHNRARPNEQERGRRGKFAGRSEEPEERPQKPSEKVSLFSFLEDKLPVTSSSSKDDCHNYHQKDPRLQTRNEPRQLSKNSAERNYYDKNTAERNYYDSSKMNKNDSNNAGTFRDNRAPKYLPNESKNHSVSRANANNSEGGNDSGRNQQRYAKPQVPYNSNTDSKGGSNSEKYSGSYGQDKGYNRYQNYPTQNQGTYQQQQQPRNERYSQGPPSKPNAPRTHTQPPNMNAENNPTEMHQLANDLSKMSVSKEFASRSLRQHLNLGPPKRQETSGGLNVGEQCLAKYWEDGKFYPATIAAMTDKTYAVQFKGYGNIEEVLKQDCFVGNVPYGQQQRPYYEQNNFSGNSMEFRSRRGPPRN